MTDHHTTLGDAVAALIEAGYSFRPAATGYGWLQADEFVSERWGCGPAHAAAMEQAMRRAGYLAGDRNGNILELQADPDSPRTMAEVDLEEAVWWAASSIADDAAGMTQAHTIETPDLRITTWLEILTDNGWQPTGAETALLPSEIAGRTLEQVAADSDPLDWDPVEYEPGRCYRSMFARDGEVLSGPEVEVPDDDEEDDDEEDDDEEPYDRLAEIIAVAQERNAHHITVGVDAQTETIAVWATVWFDGGDAYGELVADLGSADYDTDERDNLLNTAADLVSDLWRWCDLAGVDDLTPDGVLTIRLSA